MEGLSLARFWNRAVAELIGYALLYTVVFGFHTRRTVSTYNQKFRKSTSYHLPVHIATGLVEIARYQIRVARHGETVAAAGGDVVVCLIWAWTSLSLVRSLQRGDPSTTRPAYQAGTLLRPLVCAASYLLQSHVLYRVCAKAINSFIYARIGIFVLHKSGFLRKHPDSSVYSISIPVSAILSIHEGGLPGAVPVYLAAMFGIGWLNHWVSSSFKEESTRAGKMNTRSPLKNWFVHTMLTLGFAELEDIKKKRRPTSLSPDIMDEYIRRQVSGFQSSRLSSIDSIDSIDSAFTGEMQATGWDPLTADE